MNVQQEKSHYGYIDTIRAFSICMVIILHCICNYYSDLNNLGYPLWFCLGFVNELCRTGVPLFFMISGFLILKGDIGDTKTFYWKRLKKIGIPFVIYDIFYYVLYSIQNQHPISLFGFFYEFLNNGSAYHLWFMYSIMFLYLLAPFLKKIVDRCSIGMLWIFFLLTIFQTTIKPLINTIVSDHIYIYLTEDGICGYMGYMILGYILGKHTFSRKTEIFICILGLIAFVVFPCISMYNVKNGGEFLFHGGYTINHYLEAAAIFVFSKKMISTKGKFFSILASATMDAYFIHVFILERIQRISWNLSPAYTICMWAISTIFLSFLWGFLRIKIFYKKREGFKCLKKS